MPVEMVLDDLLVLAELFLDLVDRQVDRPVKVVGDRLGEEIDAVAEDVAVGDVVLLLDAEVPGDMNATVEESVEGLRSLAGVVLDRFACGHVLEAEVEIHEDLLALLSVIAGCTSIRGVPDTLTRCIA
jgi:hypothetical protein